MKLNIGIHTELLCLSIALSLTPIQANAITEGDYTYTVSNNWATITDFNSAYSGALSITNVLGGYSVGSIGNSAFQYCTNLNSVTIPSCVTNIGSSAFYGCLNLASVTIPDGVMNIGYSAFFSCSKLTRVTIPSNVKSIGISVFQLCSSLIGVTIPSSVTNIGSSAFYGCSSLTNMTIPDGMKSIGSSSFYGCSGLRNVAIPDNVTSIGSSAFYSCTGLGSMTIQGGVTAIGVSAFQSCTSLGVVTIPDSVTSIGSSAFSGCSSLSSVTIPGSVTNLSSSAFQSCTSLVSAIIQNGVKSIGISVFSGCRSLNSVTIPGSVTSIGSSAFLGCMSLASVTIPVSVISIGGSAFSGCSNLGSIDVAEGNPVYSSLDGLLFNTNGSTLIQCPAGKAGSYAIPDSVINIGSNAFSSCVSLTEVTIPSNVTSIGSGAFSGCIRLTDVAIPYNVTSIGSGAFSGCIRLTDVAIPYNVTSIGSGAFSGCTNLSAITVEALNPVYSSADGVLFNEYRTTLILCPAGKAGSYTIPGSVTNIGSGAFSGCIRLTDVALPASVTSIASGVFSGCASLSAIMVETLNPAYSSFDGVMFNKSLTSLIQCPAGKAGRFTTPTNVISIGSGAFSGCRYLTDVTLSSSVTSIVSGVFSGCTSLNVISVEALNPAYSSADGVLFNKYRTTLIQCPAGKAGSYTIPGSVTNIGSGAFSSCTRLSSITILGNIKTVGAGVFINCLGLTSVVIPAGVTNIWNSAFSGCTRLTGAYFMGNAPFANSSVFTNDNLATVYYLSTATGWGTTFAGRPTALWDMSAPMKVTFNALGGSTSPTSKEVTYSSTYDTLPTATRVGYTFTGWWTWVDGTGLQVTDTTMVTVPSDHMLYAHWTVNNYALTFDANGGTVDTASKTVTFHAVYGALPAPTRTGHTFSGWLANTNGIAWGVSSNTVVAVAADHTLTALWTANTYTATLDPNGGTVDPVNKVVSFDAMYGELPVPVKTGYTFTDWRASTNGFVFAVTPETVVAIASDHTLTANWSASTYTVTFDGQGGTVSPANKVVTFDTVYGDIPTPTRAGHTFSGWWTETDGAGAEVTAATVASITAAQTLYAGWTANTYTVTFAAGPCEIDPQPPKTVTYGATYGALPMPNRTGHTFGGWWTGDNGTGTQIYATTPVSTAADHRLHVNWTINSYTLTYLAGANGTVEGESLQSVNYGAAGLSVKAVPGAGNRFLRWSDGYADDKRTDQNVTNDILVTAMFGGVAFANDSEEVSETAGSISLIVNGGVPTGISSVRVYIQPATATASDYTVPPAAQVTLTWAAGEAGPKTVTIPIRQDALVEDAETFYVMLGSPTNCVIDEPSICQVTITDANSGLTLADALDNVLIKWTTGGTPPWSPQGAVTSDGEDAAASGAMASNKVSYVQTAVTGTGTLSFAWSVVGRGTMRLYDGTKVLAAVTNDTPWETRTVALTQNATHSLKWAFTQGGSTNGRAYLDQVAWLPGGKAGVAVTAGANDPEGGTVSGTGVYYAGAKVPLNAKPRTGWLFTGWTPANLFIKPVAAAQTLTVGGNAVTVTANFVRLPVVTGLPCPPEGGAVTGSGVCLPGKSVTLQATASKYWCFTRWSDGLQTVTRIVKASNEDVTILAEFKLVSQIAPPVITVPGAQRAMVGVPFTLAIDITSDSLPAVTVSGLPVGLGYNAVTKTIFGVPTASVTNRTLRVTAKNVNKTPTSQEFQMTVDPLPTWAVGTFNGAAGMDALGSGSAAMSVTAKGAVSGKLTLRGTNFSFSATSYTARGGDGHFTLVSTAKVGKVAWPLTVSVNVPEITDTTGTVPLTLSKAEGVLSSNGWMTLYRNIWKDAGMVTVLTNRFTGYYTAVLPGGSEYGSGYLAFTVDRAGGMKTVGKLADGTPVSLAGTLILDEAGRVFAVLYTVPAAYKGGGLFGLAEFVKVPGNAKMIVRLLDGEPFVWESLNPTAMSDYYAQGFSRELGLTGGWYDTLGNLCGYYGNRVMTVGTEGMPVPDILVGTNRYDSACWDPDGLVLTVVTNKLGVLTALAAPGTVLPVKIGSSSVYDYMTGTNTVGLTVGLTRETGVFKGAFKAWFDYGTTHTSKPIFYEGVLTPEREDKDDGVAGRGFFLWADKAQYTNSYNRLTPYSFSCSYDLKILLPFEMVRVQGGSLPDIGNGAITVDSFFIGACEVTWAEWQTVREWAVTNDYDIGSVGEGSAANHPVQSVNWYDCVKWCNARSQMEGRMPAYYTDAGFTLIYKAGEILGPFVNAAADGYRLPTDAEWEFAARGGTQSLGYEFSGGKDLNAVGWHLGNSGGSDKAVGTKTANELGLYDMSGNVWEWCFDWHHGEEGSDRVCRGGSWANGECNCLSVNSIGTNPIDRFNSFGFRAARNLP